MQFPNTAKVCTAPSAGADVDAAAAELLRACSASSAAARASVSARCRRPSRKGMLTTQVSASSRPRSLPLPPSARAAQDTHTLEVPAFHLPVS